LKDLTKQQSFKILKTTQKIKMAFKEYYEIDEKDYHRWEMKEIDSVIKEYIQSIKSNPYHRFLSWDYCFKAFGEEKNTRHTEVLALYLANWGMYRGSSGLLKTNHKVHTKAIDILYSPKAQKIRCDQSKEVSLFHIQDILEIKNELCYHYSTIDFGTNQKDTIKITPTDTLISKIMLGTLGCTPAYDTYTQKILSRKENTTKNFNHRSLEHFFQFAQKNSSSISKNQKYIQKEINQYYPVMKVIDIYFWTLGNQLL
jgi:hypothetical protein